MSKFVNYYLSSKKLFLLFIFCCVLISCDSVNYKDSNLSSESESIQSLAPTAANGFNKPQNTDFRIGCYNVWGTSVYDKPAKKASWKRLVKAVNADIWILNEMFYLSKKVVWTRGDADAFLKEIKSYTGKSDWEYSTDMKGRFLLSRFPIIWDSEIKSRVHATWINMPDNLSSKDMLVVNVHLRGGEKKTAQANVAIDFLKSVRNGSYNHKNLPRKIPQDIPIVFAGDFNVDYNSALYKLIKSKVNLTDPRPFHMGVAGNNDNTFGIVKMRQGEAVEIGKNTKDYVLYKSSSFNHINSFVMNTFTMSDKQLLDYGLEKKDVAKQPQLVKDPNNGDFACDHFPLIVDFEISQ